MYFLYLLVFDLVGHSTFVTGEFRMCSDKVSEFEEGKTQSSSSSLTLNSHAEGKLTVYRAQTWP